MDADRSNPCFGRWAVTGVIAPFVVILVLTFGIAPFFWPDLADGLGNALGYILIYYLLGVAVAAGIWKIRHERKHRPRAASDKHD